MISDTRTGAEVANHSLVIGTQFINKGSMILCVSQTVQLSHRKFVTIALTHRKSRIKRHPGQGSHRSLVRLSYEFFPNLGAIAVAIRQFLPNFRPSSSCNVHIIKLSIMENK